MPRSRPHAPQPPDAVELGSLPATGAPRSSTATGLHQPLLDPSDPGPGVDDAFASFAAGETELWPPPETGQSQHELESFERNHDKSFAKETWFEFLSSTRPLPGSCGAVTIRSAVVCFAVVPLILFCVGMIIDEILHGTPIFFHSTVLLSVGYVVAPFSVLYANWPRQTVFNKNLAKGSRVVWDIALSVWFLVMLVLYSRTLATSDPQTAFLYQTAVNIFNGYENVTDEASFWQYIKEDLASTLITTKMLGCYYNNPAFNGSVYDACTVPLSDTRPVQNWCAKADPHNLVCREGFSAPPGEGCVNALTDLQGDVPYLSVISGTAVGLRIRQVRTKKTISHVYGGGGDGMEITPPFELQNEDEATWGQGALWQAEYPTVREYRDQAMAAVMLSINCTANDRNLGFLPSDYPLAGWPDDGGRLTGENMTWPGVLTGAAWYYEDGSYQNLPGRVVTPPRKYGPTRLTLFPPGGFMLTLPGVNHGFLRAGVVSAATTLQNQHWLDDQTRLITLEYMMVAANTNKWATVSVDFEFTADGQVISALSTAFGNLDSVVGVADNTQRWIRPVAELYYMVLTFTVYYISTFVIKTYEHGSFLVMVGKEMVKMDIATQALVITAWCILLESIYYWSGAAPGVNDDVKPYGFLGYQLMPITTGGMWQSSRDFVGIALILQWLRFIEYLVLIPQVGVVPRAIILGLGTVGYFLITMLFILSAFVAGFNVIYAATTTAFSTPAQTVLTLWSALLGNVDVDDFIATRYYVGIVLFLFFSFFTLFVFLTMLMAVIGDAYERAKREAEEAEEKVRKTVPQDAPARKVLALKVEGYFEHFRSLDR